MLNYQPDNAETLRNLGLNLSRRGRIPEAMAEFKRAVAIDPGGNLYTSKAITDEHRVRFSTRFIYTD